MKFTGVTLEAGVGGCGLSMAAAAADHQSSFTASNSEIASRFLSAKCNAMPSVNFNPGLLGTALSSP